MKWTITTLYLLVFLSLFGFGWTIDQIYDQYQDAENDQFLGYKSVFKTIRQHVEKHNSANSAPTLFNLPPQFQLDPIQQFPLPVTLKDKLDKGEIIILDSEQGLSLHQRLSTHPYVLSYGPIVGALTASNTTEYTLTILFYIGIAMVLAIWITPLLSSVQKLSTAIKQVGEGMLETRLDQKRLTLSTVFRDFNIMADRLESLSDNNQLFSQAVSHDLRTPLSRIMFALEHLKKIENKQQQLDVLKKIENDVFQIDSLSAELLEYARIEKTRKIEKSQVDLIIFIQQVIAEFYHDGRLIEFKTPSPSVCLYTLDGLLFHKVINNLLSNAIQHGKHKILVTLTIKQDKSIQISVEDDGIGLNETRIQQIFKPFSKSAQNSGHFGLGLAICSRVIKILGGEIKADNCSSLGGARFTVELPAQI